MRIRPFDSQRFLVDVERGDILAESGQLLIIGRPEGLQASGYHFEDPVFWEPADFPGHRTRRIKRHLREDLPWTSIYSFPYRPKSRARLPERPSDLSAIHYFLLRNGFELFLLQALTRSKIRGDATLGLAPLSWRKPSVVAHAMVEALAGMFYCIRNKPEPRTQTVVIRSLDEPDEMLRVFDRPYFREWSRRLRKFPELWDIWSPA